MSEAPGPAGRRGRRGRIRLRILTATAVGSLLLAGCQTTSSAPPVPTSTLTFTRAATDDFVTASGRNFLVDGKPFRFVGMNIYDAAATDRYSCNKSAMMSEQDLNSTFQLLHDKFGVSVVRFWAYQTYTDSGRDYSGMDHVIAAAKASGIRLLPVLEDGPGYCTSIDPALPKAQYESDTWFTDGYRKQFGTAVLSYRDYARIIAEHYQNEPTILGWSMINEADTSARDSQNQSVLVDFAQDMITVLRSVDSHHLITLGTQSNGAAGASGPDFSAVYGLSGLDFAEVHDWGYWGSDQEPMPGGTGATPPDPKSAACQSLHAKVGCSFAMAPALNKPLVVGEAGIDRGDGNSAALAARATLLKAKMDAAFAAGASGYLLWRVTTQVTDKYDILTSDHDPLLDDLAVEAAAIG